MGVEKFWTTVSVRWGLIIFMAFFLAVMLESQSRDTRMIAALFLLALSQIRETVLVWAADEDRKKKSN
jgi:hypothetical protein